MKKHYNKTLFERDKVEDIRMETGWVEDQDGREFIYLKKNGDEMWFNKGMLEVVVRMLKKIKKEKRDDKI